jgi:hypothetical protein
VASLVNANAEAQKYFAPTKDRIVSIFVNSKEVIEEAFKPCHIPDTGTLIILDVNNLLANFNQKEWFGHPVEIVKQGKLLDSLKSFDAHFLLKSRSNYFVLRETKSSKETRLFIHHPYDNLLCDGVLKKKKEGYYIIEFQSGVI